MNKTLTHGTLGQLNYPLHGILDASGYERIWPQQKVSLPKTLIIHNHRISIQGLSEARPTFFSFPLLYVSYATIKSMISKKGYLLSFVLVKERSGMIPEILAQKIAKETGLQAFTQSTFSNKKY